MPPHLDFRKWIEFSKATRWLRDAWSALHAWLLQINEADLCCQFCDLLSLNIADCIGSSLLIYVSEVNGYSDCYSPRM